MKQRYNDLTFELCSSAALRTYDGKWRRGDFLRTAEKYSGIARHELLRAEFDGDLSARLEAADGIGYELLERMDCILDGTTDDLDLEPVKIRKRIDGITRKVRDIASCCPLHQCFGHLLILGLAPLLRTKILPCQHASIPGHGQTACKRQIVRALRSGKLGIRHAKKTDVCHAYGSVTAEVIYTLVAGEIPNARWILSLLWQLLMMNPGHTLLIGGYPDAWLFNLLMSYALRQLLAMRKSRRGSSLALVKACPDYMDDAVPLGSRKADVNRAAREYSRFMKNRFGLDVKLDGAEVSWLSIADEVQRCHASTPGGRGCPGLDMAGYVIHRTYVTIRPVVFLRARRQLLRAAREFEQSGTLPIWRAQRIISYAGFFKQSDSRKAKSKYSLIRLKEIAEHVVSHHARVESRERRERFEKYWCKHRPLSGTGSAGTPA